MTIPEWRMTKRFVRSARQVLDHTTLQEMIQLLKENSPVVTSCRNLPTNVPTTEYNHSRLLGLVEGYFLAIECLESLGKPAPKPQASLTATFEPEQE